MSAVDISPKFVPVDDLYPRDNSGGPGFDSHCGMFGDHRTTGAKDYLSGGKGTGGKSRSRKSDRDNDGDEY